MDSKELLKSDLTVNEIKNEQVESLQTDLKQNVQEKDGENAVPQQASFSFDEKMHEVFKTPEISVRLQTDSAWLKESHKPEYERRLKKRHLLKKNEYEMVPVTTGKEEIVNRKKSLAAMVDKNVNERKSDLVRLQDGIDINVAKKTNFTTVKNLSAFVENTKDQAEFTELVKSYTSGRFTVLSELTKKIMSIKPSEFDVSTMQRIAETSGKLELMVSQVDAYQELLKANEDYKEKLKAQKDEAGKSYLTRVEERLRELGKISRYYRIQKLIMEDSVYQNSRNNEISMEVSEKDDFQTKRLKKLLRVSYYMGKNLSGADLPDLEAEGKLSRTSNEYAKKNFDESADDKTPEMEVRKLEFERLFVPPDYLKLKLSTSERSNDPMIPYFGAASLDEYVSREATVQCGKKDLMDKVLAYKKNDIPGGMLLDPKFTKAKTFDGKTDFTDNFDRMVTSFAVFAYRQNDDEFFQIVKHMSIAHSKRYAEHQNDEEAMKYYESCFVDAAVKYQAFEYAAIRRLGNGFGDLPFVMHPKDFVLQSNCKMMAHLHACSTISNHYTKENEPLYAEFMKKFNHGDRYPVDIKEMENMGGAYMQVIMKGNMWLEAVRNDINFKQGKLFPKDTGDKIITWWNENHKDKQINTVDYIQISEWMSAFHKDDVTSGAFFEKKDPDGNEILNKAMIAGNDNMLTGDITEIQAMLSYDGILHPSEEEVAEYEKQMKQKKYFQTGTEEDPYLIKQYRKKFRDLTSKADGSFSKNGMPDYVDRMSEKDQQLHMYFG